MLHPEEMGRPKKYDHPPNMTFDQAATLYIVRNPVTGKRKRFADEGKALKAVTALNKFLETERALRALEHGLPKISGLVAKWIEDRLPFMPWSEGTKANYLAKMRRISRELGERPIKHTDCMFLEDWIANIAKTGDTFNDWRYMFVLLWGFAVSRKLADSNEGEKVLERSTSKKIEANRKQRLPLDVDGFNAIHEKSEPWLRLAMETSLVTLQGRSEIANMRLADSRKGFLHVIRDKTSADSDMAFIKIEVTAQIEEFWSLSRTLDNTVSPYLIHRKPHDAREQWIKGKPHWTYITPDYLGRAFAEARDSITRFASLPESKRPSFHEIRGLGSRLCAEQGMTKKAIQALMTHTHERVTEIYLQGGAEALTDDDYQRVEAPLVLRGILR